MNKKLLKFVKKNLSRRKYARIKRENELIYKYFDDIDIDSLQFYLDINLLSYVDNLEYYNLLKLSEYDDLLANNYFMYNEDIIYELDLFLLKLVTRIDVPLSKKEFNKIKKNYDLFDLTAEGYGLEINDKITIIFKILKKQIYD